MRTASSRCIYLDAEWVASTLCYRGASRATWRVWGMYDSLNVMFIERRGKATDRVNLGSDTVKLGAHRARVEVYI